MMNLQPSSETRHQDAELAVSARVYMISVLHAQLVQGEAA
jgi:hypothetical protein